MNVDELGEALKQSMIATTYKEAQLGRSLRYMSQQVQEKFKKELFRSIPKLVKKVDNGSLRNDEIRNEIKLVSKKSGCSAGQSQKAINVYLKVYCLFNSNPVKETIVELDCPLDSKIMSKYKTKNLKKKYLKDMNFEDYLAWQKHVEAVGVGIRIATDMIYDKNRVNEFLKNP